MGGLRGVRAVSRRRRRGIRPQLRARVYALDRHRCVYCGAREPLTLDHVLPHSRGGRATRANLVTACAGCNQRRGDTPIDEWVARILAMPR